MNTFEELEGYPTTTKRYQEKIHRDKELEVLKQELLEKLRVEIRDLMNQKKIEVEEEIMAYLGGDLEKLEKALKEIKDTIITRDDMGGTIEEFIAEFFNNFTQAAENGITDPKIRHALIDVMRTTKRRWNKWK